MTVNTNGEVAFDGSPTDTKGRTLTTYMSDRELLESILANQRTMMDTVNDFMESMKSNPMMKMMVGKR